MAFPGGLVAGMHRFYCRNLGSIPSQGTDYSYWRVARVSASPKLGKWEGLCQ